MEDTICPGRINGSVCGGRLRYIGKSGRVCARCGEMYAKRYRSFAQLRYKQAKVKGKGR